MRSIGKLRKIADEHIPQGKYAWKPWLETIASLSPLEKEYVLEHVKFRLLQMNKMKDALHLGSFGMQHHSYHEK